MIKCALETTLLLPRCNRPSCEHTHRLTGRSQRASKQEEKGQETAVEEEEEGPLYILHLRPALLPLLPLLHFLLSLQRFPHPSILRYLYLRPPY